MGKTYEELMAALGPERRGRVAARARELLAEERSLRQLRTTRQLTQERLAKQLGISQHSVSRLEQRSDMLLSTLRDYVRTLGGELVLTAHFPGQGAVQIKGIDKGTRRSAHRRVRRATPRALTKSRTTGEPQRKAQKLQ